MEAVDNTMPQTKTIDVDDLTGKALDWVVSQALGNRVVTVRDYVAGVVGTEKAIDEQLKWKLALHGDQWLEVTALGTVGLVPSYSNSWNKAGFVLKVEKMLLVDTLCKGTNRGNVGRRWQGSMRQDGADIVATGPTGLTAMLRCFVKAKLGTQVAVPSELLPEAAPATQTRTQRAQGRQETTAVKRQMLNNGSEICGGHYGHAQLNSVMMAEIRRQVAGRQVLDLGCGDLSLALLCRRLGAAHVTAIDSRYPHESGWAPGEAMSGIDFIQASFADIADGGSHQVVLVSWPSNNDEASRHLCRLTAEVPVVIYIGRNDGITQCGTPLLWRSLTGRETLATFPRHHGADAMIVYGNEARQSPLTDEEWYGLDLHLVERGERKAQRD